MLNVAAVQPWSYGCTWEVCLTLKKLAYPSFVLSNLPRASITPWFHAARLPFLKCKVNWKTWVLCASSIERLLFINFDIANFIEFEIV